MTKITHRILACHAASWPLLFLTGMASALAAPQASLTVACGSTGICNATNTEWTLDKSAQVNGSTVTWTIAATKGTESHAFLTFTGSLNVTNTGSANATIGNIVVNLQAKKGGNKYATISSDMANSTLGDAAPSAAICSGASSEGLSSFSKNAGSGTLNLTDASNNSIFSLTPQKVIAPGETVTLNYVATFDATVLNIAPGTSIRLESIVSFGNSGGRGDSGASCSNIDINGNGVIDTDEAKVRSVPCRSSFTVPVLERSNSSVVLSDTASNITTTGSVVFSDFTTDIGGGLGYETLTNSATRTVSIHFTEGPSGGSVTNCAHLDAYPTPSCNQPVMIEKCDTQLLDGDSFGDGDYCSVTQGGWGGSPNGNNPAALLAYNFSTVYPSGVEVGIPGTGGYSMKFNLASTVSRYLPAGGPAAALNADLINPLTTSSGVFGGQVLALELNVDMNRPGVLYGTRGSIAGLVLHDTGTALDGQTIQQVLAMANTLLGGGTLSNGVTIPIMQEIVTDLNEAFDGCNPSAWAQEHLTVPARFGGRS